MALTPQDVLHKQFERVSEGFDPEEVDDYLDEIFVEWRKTVTENEELKARLAAFEAGETPEAAAPVTTEEGVVETVPQASGDDPVATSAGIIELAHRLHDEHVAAGQSQRDKMVSEAESHSEKLVTDAQEKAHQIVSEAEERSREELSRLESERSVLESRITELRQFERDYRAQLRSFIEDKLRDLDTTGTTSVSSVGP